MASASGVVIARVYESNQEPTAGESDFAKASPTAAALVAPGEVAGGYGEAFQKYGVTATPTLFVVDRKGIVRHADADSDKLEGFVGVLLKP